MTTGSLPHIILFLSTVIFLILTCLIVSKLSRKWQNIMFIIATLIGSGGILFRYALNLSFSDGLNISRLLIQMLQVCNFNFILLILMLIPRFEVARQYSVFFSMFAAATTLFSFPVSYSQYEWNDPIILNFWLNHVFAIALPLWMIFSRRLVPQKKYIPLISGCIVLYFVSVYLFTELLMKVEILPLGSSFSYVHDPKGMPIISGLYELIGLPLVHLIPLLPVLIIFFYLFAFMFKEHHNIKY